MSDLISRQAAIDTEGLDEQIRCEMCRNPMHTDRGCDGNCKYDEKLYERIMLILGERITALPSTQPERKKGAWIWKGEEGDSRFMCSVCKCKENVPTCNGVPNIWEFCPNCGADMREEGEHE